VKATPGAGAVVGAGARQRKENRVKKTDRHEQRIAKAKQRIADWRDEDRPEDVVSGLAYRAHIVAVLEDLGVKDAVERLRECVDERIAAGLEELDIIGLAFGGGLLAAIKSSKVEVVKKTIANAKEAKAEAGRRAIEGDPKNGPVIRPSRKQSL
jgi:hypothetical protein